MLIQYVQMGDNDNMPNELAENKMAAWGNRNLWCEIRRMSIKHWWIMRDFDFPLSTCRIQYMRLDINS